jgi:hypothetical protein
MPRDGVAWLQQKIAIVGSLPDVDWDCEIANYYVPSRKNYAYFRGSIRKKEVSF